MLGAIAARAADAGAADDALCELLAEASTGGGGDDDDDASRVCLGVGADAISLRTYDRANEVGLRPWPAAEVLAEWAAAQTWDGRRVLELGAGLGLAAVALARRGAFVVATDGDARVCANLRHNVALNDVDERRCRVEEFRWEDHAAFFSREAPFDSVVAADCVYDADVAPALAATLAGALRRNPRCDVWVANAVRNAETWAATEAALLARGLDLEDGVSVVAGVAAAGGPRFAPPRVWAERAAALRSGALRLVRVATTRSGGGL